MYCCVKKDKYSEKKLLKKFGCYLYDDAKNMFGKDAKQFLKFIQDLDKKINFDNFDEEELVDYIYHILECPACLWECDPKTCKSGCI